MSHAEEEDVYQSPGRGGNGSSSTAGLHRKVEREVGFGRVITHHDKRKYKFDRLSALSVQRPLGWYVTKSDRMSADEAGAALFAILDLWKMVGESDDVQFAFTEGLFFCHTINSGSILQPDRSRFGIQGRSEKERDSVFDFIIVVRYLNVDTRRFFRAYADDIIQVNQRVLDRYDPEDIVSVEKYSWLMEVAIQRGLLKYPHLSHDSSDKAMNLTPTERMAVANSKMGVFANIVNSVDRLSANARMPTADDYDSTNGITVATHAKNAQ